MSKKWYQSKTLWFNVVMAVLDVVNGVYGVVNIPAELKVYVLVIGNVALRFLTTQPVEGGTK